MHRFICIIFVINLCAPCMSGMVHAADDFAVCVRGSKVRVKPSCDAGEHTLTQELQNISLQCANSGLQAEDFSGADGPPGARGLEGPPGGRGPSASSYGEIGDAKSMLFGIISGEISDPMAYTRSAYASFKAVLRQAISPEKIVIRIPDSALDGCVAGDPCIAAAERESSKQTLCPGSAAEPLSAPGILCIYPIYLLNVAELRPGTMISPFGFSLRYSQHEMSNPAAFTAVWTYQEE